LQDALIFLVEVHLKPVLGYSSEIGYCKVNFYNVHVELYRIGAEVEVTLKQEIIELIRLSATEDIGNIGFDSS